MQDINNETPWMVNEVDGNQNALKRKQTKYCHVASHVSQVFKAKSVWFSVH